MIQYSLWFRLQVDGNEREELDAIRAFLRELQVAGEIAGFQILRNRSGSKTTRLPFQALIKFRDNAHFSTAFARQAARGIHAGLHGRVMAAVDEFQIEVFEEVLFAGEMALPEEARQFACEI